MWQNSRIRCEWILSDRHARNFFFNVHDEVDPLVLSKEKVTEYINKFSDLVVAITKNSSEVALCFGTTLFNDVMFNRDKVDNSKILGKIKIAKNKSIYNNYYLKIVSQLFTQTKWQELFGLNILETMDLEYSQYIYLKKLLEEYEKKYKVLAENSLSDLDKKQKELASKYKDDI